MSRALLILGIVSVASIAATGCIALGTEAPATASNAERTTSRVYYRSAGFTDAQGQFQDPANGRMMGHVFVHDSTTSNGEFGDALFDDSLQTGPLSEAPEEVFFPYSIRGTVLTVTMDQFVHEFSMAGSIGDSQISLTLTDVRANSTPVNRHELQQAKQEIGSTLHLELDSIR